MLDFLCFRLILWQSHKKQDELHLTEENSLKVNSIDNIYLAMQKGNGIDFLKNDLQYVLSKTMFPYYKVKDSCDKKDYFIVFNPTFNDAKTIAKMAHSQSFVFEKRTNEETVFELWTKSSKNSWGYKISDRQFLLKNEINDKDEYKKVSDRFKFNVSFNTFKKAETEMTDFYNQIKITEAQLSQLLDDTRTGLYRLGKRSTLYNVSKTSFNRI